MDSSASNGYLGHGNEREIAPSFLFGERTNKRKALALSGRPSVFGSPGILKKDFTNAASPGKNVRWSSDLVQEQVFSNKIASSPLTSGTPPVGLSTPFAAGPTMTSMVSKGPPLVSLDLNDLEPPQKLTRPDVSLDRKEAAINAINSHLNAFNATSANSSDYWVTVYGFTPGERDMVLNVFSRHGTIVSHNVPRLGNWVHIRYSSVLHAQQALKRDGNIIGDRLMVGVVKCTDKEVVSDTKMNPLNTSLNNFVDTSFGSPVMQSTFKHANDEDQMNGSRAANSLNFADATSFSKSRLSALSRNGMRSLRANEMDVSLNSSAKKDESFLGKFWNFIAPP